MDKARIKKETLRRAEDIAEKTVIDSYGKFVTPVLEQYKKLAIWQVRLLVAATALVVLILVAVFVFVVLGIVALL